MKETTKNATMNIKETGVENIRFILKGKCLKALKDLTPQIIHVNSAKECVS
jgi:hypothetical protein